MRTRITAVLLGLPALLLGSTQAYAALENRTTVTYPSASTITTMTSAGINIPTGGTTYSDSSFGPNGSLVIADNDVAENGYAYINRPVDLVANDFSITYRIQTPSDARPSTAATTMAVGGCKHVYPP